MFCMDCNSSSVYDPNLDCSDPVNLKWPVTGEFNVELIQELHTITARDLRDEARRFIAEARTKLPKDVMLKPSEMTGIEVERAKRALIHARFSDLQAEICSDVARLHSLKSAAASLRSTAKGHVLDARARLTPGAVVAVRDMKGPEIDEAKRLLAHALQLERSAKSLENVILMKRARYDGGLAAVIVPEMNERLMAVRAILSY